MSERQAKEQNRKHILWVKNSKGLCTCFRNTQTEEKLGHPERDIRRQASLRGRDAVTQIKDNSKAAWVTK